METTNIKNEPEAHHDKNESFETPTNINNKRKSESLLESNNSNLETSQTSISPQSNASSSNLVTGREKRIRKIKAYDDDFLMYDMPSCSNSSLFQNLTKQMIPAQENTNEIKYNLGDLVWAKVSGHPWWPCMITNPELSATNSIKNYNEAKNENSHLRLIGGSRPKRSYYVEFFGPSIEHAWVPEGNIIEYKGIEEFKAYTQEQIDRANSKSAKDKLTEKFSLKITLPKRDGWDQAIIEADSFINKKIRDRKIHFINKHIETGIIKKENSFELEEPKINNKNKRNSIDSNEESFQNETKKLKTEKSLPKKKEKSQNEIPKVLKSNETKRKISLESNLDTNTKQEKIETQIKKPLQSTNILNISNTNEKNNQEIDDESLLKMIKTRLTGLTLLHGNLLKLDKIAEKYNLSKQTLFYDFFGFNQNDQNFPSTEDTLDKSNFISKIESFKNELENTYRSVGDSLKESDSNIKNLECVKTIPRAMIALKLKLPMLFANIISDYLNKFPSQNTDELAKENSSFSCDLIEMLYTFRRSLFLNRKDLNKLKNLIEEIQNLDFVINKSIVSIKAEISEEINEPVISNESEKNEPTVSNNV